MCSIVLMISTLILSVVSDSSLLEISSPAGIFRGTALVSFTGRKFASFRGIPYAQPPIGKLRFAKPQLQPVFQGVFDATKEAPICLQPLNVNLGNGGQEDCLYLNVFTPLHMEKPTGSKWKVLVQIHGGAFFLGSGNEYIPGDLVTQGDIIVVTLNYRLSWLGFLKGNTPNLPGNQGLWDQLMALQWIKKNIEAFGGDPLDVTIAGESMGGESVSVWSMLKQGKDLFTKGIVMSGTMFSCPSTPGSSNILLDLLLDRVGCWPPEYTDDDKRSSSTFSEATTDWVITCMRDLPSEKFVLPAEGSLTNKFTSIDGDLFHAAIPELVKDKKYMTDVGFFSKHFIVSLVNHEGAPLTNGVFAAEVGADSEEQFLSKKIRIPIDLVGKTYDWYKQSNVSGFNILHDMWSDQILAIPTFEFLRIHTQKLDSLPPGIKRGYSYFLWFNLNPSFMPPPCKGLFHALDLGYMFDMKPSYMLKTFYQMDIDKDFTEEDWKLKMMFIQIVTDFMKYGEPSHTLMKDFDTTWPAYDEEKQFYLDFKSDFSVEQFPLHKRRHFWTDTFPKWTKELQEFNKKNEL